MVVVGVMQATARCCGSFQSVRVTAEVDLCMGKGRERSALRRRTIPPFAFELARRRRPTVETRRVAATAVRSAGVTGQAVAELLAWANERAPEEGRASWRARREEFRVVRRRDMVVNVVRYAGESAVLG